MSSNYSRKSLSLSCPNRLAALGAADMIWFLLRRAAIAKLTDLMRFVARLW